MILKGMGEVRKVEEDVGLKVWKVRQVVQLDAASQRSLMEWLKGASIGERRWAYDEPVSRTMLYDTGGVPSARVPKKLFVPVSVCKYESAAQHLTLWSRERSTLQILSLASFSHSPHSSAVLAEDLLRKSGSVEGVTLDCNGSWCGAIGSVRAGCRRDDWEEKEKNRIRSENMGGV